MNAASTFGNAATERPRRLAARPRDSSRYFGARPLSLWRRFANSGRRPTAFGWRLKGPEDVRFGIEVIPRALAVLEPGRAKANQRHLAFDACATLGLTLTERLGLGHLAKAYAAQCRLSFGLTARSKIPLRLA